MAFKDLKTVVTTVLVLVSPQESDPFWIKADSSDFATGAVLSQLSMKDRKWHPVAFYSKSLSSVERVQKRIVHWNKPNHAMPAPNYVLKVQGEIIKDEGL